MTNRTANIAVRLTPYAMFVVVIATLVVAASRGTTTAASDPPPFTPPVADQGLPEPGGLLTVAGPDGEPIICPDGRPLKIELSEAPPPSPGEQAPGGDIPPSISPSDADLPNIHDDLAGQPAVAQVPRCGPAGGGPDADPIWVPESIGHDTVVAPQSYTDAQTP